MAARSWKSPAARPSSAAPPPGCARADRSPRRSPETARIPGRFLVSRRVPMRTPVLLALLMVPLVAQAQQSPLGRWKTVDDATGKPRGVVEIYRASDGRYAGRVVGILDTSNGPNPVCDKCEGERKG